MARKHTEKGNVLFMILMAIVLLAAITFSMTRGGRTNSSISAEESALFANSIMQYSDKLRTAVQGLVANGTPVSKISFENDVVADYTNANGAGNGDKVFHSSGGGIVYKAPDEKWIDSAQSGQGYYKQWFFSNAICVPYVGTGDGTCANDEGTKEIAVVLPYIKKSVCQQINRRLNLCNGEPCVFLKTIGISDSYKYTGSFQNNNAATTATNDLDGKTEGCASGSGDAGEEPADAYFYYKVLIAR